MTGKLVDAAASIRGGHAVGWLLGWLTVSGWLVSSLMLQQSLEAGIVPDVLWFNEVTVQQKRKLEIACCLRSYHCCRLLLVTMVVTRPFKTLHRRTGAQAHDLETMRIARPPCESRAPYRSASQAHEAEAMSANTPCKARARPLQGPRAPPARPTHALRKERARPFEMLHRRTRLKPWSAPPVRRAPCKSRNGTCTMKQPCQTT